MLLQIGLASQYAEIIQETKIYIVDYPGFDHQVIEVQKDDLKVKLFTFFHFSWNSLPQVHVFFRAQEKTSSLRKSTKNACHAHSRPFHTKNAPKMSGKKLT